MFILFVDSFFIIIVILFVDNFFIIKVILVLKKVIKMSN